MTEYVVSWHASGTTIIEADSEGAAKKKAYAAGAAKLCKDADSLRVSSVDEYYEIPPEEISDV